MKQLIQHINPSFSSFRALTRKLLLLFSLLLVGVGNVWGWDCETTVKDHPLSSPEGQLTISNPGNNIVRVSGKDIFQYDYKKNNQTLVTFQLSLSSGNISNDDSELYLGNGSKGGNKYATLSWTNPPLGYALKVTKVTVKTRVYSGRNCTCTLNSGNNSVNHDVHSSFGTNTDVTLQNSGGISSPVGVNYSYENKTESNWFSSRQTYINEIIITFTLTHEEPLFNFKANASTLDTSMGNAYVELTNLGDNSTHTSVNCSIQKPMGTSSTTCKVYYTAKPKTNYQFVGWGTTSTATSYLNPIIEKNYEYTLTNNHNKTDCLEEKTLYAIFAKFKLTNPNTTPFTGGEDFPVLDFGKVAYNSARIDRVFTIDAHNVGTSISQTGLDGSLFSAAISNFKNDNSNHVCSVKVTLNPSVRSGVVRDTLNISTPRGGTISVVVKADIDPKPTFTWNDQIWDANGNQIKAPIYVDDPILENIVSSNSTGDTTCTVREIEVYGTNNESAVFPTFSNNQITCGKAGLFEFKVDQAKEDGNGYEASSSSRTLRIIKRTPAISWNATVPYYFNQTYPNTNYPSVFTLTSGDAELIDNYASTDTDVATFVDGVVTTYNVDRTTTLSVRLAENYKWNSETFTKPIHPVKANNHVPFTINTTAIYGVLAPNVSVGNASFEDDVDRIRLNEYEIKTWTTKQNNQVSLHFEGIPDKLRFKISTSKDPVFGTFPPGDGDHDFYIEEKSDNGVWTSVWTESNILNGNYEVQLNPSTRHLRFGYNGTLHGYYENISVTELRQFEALPDTINFGVVNVNKHPQEIAEFSHANAGYKVNVTPASHFDASPTTIPNTGGDRMGTQPLAITFHPVLGVEQSYDERIYFTDQLNNKDSIVVLAQTTFLNVPEFSWNPLGRPYYCSPTNPDTTYYIPNICSSSNTSRTLAYETLDNKSGIAEVKNDTLFIYTKTPQEVTIKVSQEEVPGQWMAHEETYTISIRMKPDLSVPFVMTEEIFNKNYSIYSPLWSFKAFRWSQHNDQYKWDSWSGIKLGGDETTAWADFVGIEHPYLPSMTWDDKYVIFEFEGTPDTLSFYYRTNMATATFADWYVAVRSSEPTASDNTWTIVWSDTRSESSLSEKVELALPHSARFIKFCYSGNFAGYFKDIRITALDGYFFMKTPDSHYLSRGGASPNNSAVVDDYGIAIRKSKVSNSDNSKIFTRLEYVDNGRYLCQSDNSLITNEKSNVIFVEKEQTDGTIVYTNDNEDRYIAPNADRTLTLSSSESQAIHWHLETPSVHAKAIAALNDEQVRSATSEFGEEIESLDKLRGRLYNEDYTKEIVLDTHFETSEQQEFSNGYADVYPNSENGVVNNLKEGLYRLSVKALYRIGPNKRAIEAHVGGYDCPTAYVYVDDLNSTNKAKTRLHSVYDFAQGENKGDGGHPDFPFNYSDSTAYYPNGTVSATYHFGLENSYENDVYIFIHKDENTGKGSLRYGIKAPSNANDSNWLCYQRITLTRLYRKEFIFDNGGVEKDSLWSNSTNWEYEGTHNHGMIPGLTHKVIIKEPVIVSNEETGAYKVSYYENGNGHIIVKPNGSLSVREGGFSEGYFGTQNHITLEANIEGQTGALFLYPGIKAPNATVQFYSVIANPEDKEDWEWQYIGSPVTKETVDFNERLFYNCWLYLHTTKTNAWSNAGNWNKMEPFRSYMFTRNDGETGSYGTRPSTGPLFAYSGQLNPAKDTVLTLQYEGVNNCNNFIANSWPAPIAISKFKERDFVDVEKTIYVWDKSGQCFTIAPFTSGSAENDTLPAMQGFMVKALSKDAKLSMNYESLVWKNEMTKNSPLKAPMRNRWDDDDDEKQAGSDLLSRVRIDMISEDSIPDHIFLLEKEGEGFSRDFTEGYDAPKYFVDGLPCIYTYETSGTHLAVSATDDVVGTYLAINTNASQNYTLTFSKVIGEGLGLRDLVTNTIVPITEGMQYAFTAPANSSPMLRFVVVEHEETPQWNNNNGTSLEDVGGEFKIWQSGEILSVIGAGSHANLRLYDAAGKLILSEFFNEATAISLTALPTGVYMVQVNDKTEKVLR